MSNLKFQYIQRQSAWAPGNTSSSLPKHDFFDMLSKSLPRCDILWHFWKRWGQNQCQTPTMSPWPSYPSKKTIDMSDVLFDSLYNRITKREGMCSVENRIVTFWKRWLGDSNVTPQYGCRIETQWDSCRVEAINKRHITVDFKSASRLVTLWHARTYIFLFSCKSSQNHPKHELWSILVCLDII